jgi:hypothetical protein
MSDPITLASCKLVPFSGVQFYVTTFDRDTSGPFSKNFYVARQRIRMGGVEEVRLSLKPDWDDDNPDAQVEPPPEYEYETVSKLKSYEAFVGQWMPVPVLKVLGETARGTRFDIGPTNWARVLVTPQDAGASAREAAKFSVVYAFDTHVVNNPADETIYICPTEADAWHEVLFRFAPKINEVSRFLRDERQFEKDGKSDKLDLQRWMSAWVERVFERYQRSLRPGKIPDEEERSKWPIQAWCRYMAFVQLLAKFAPPPEIRFADTLSGDVGFRKRHDNVSDQSRKPVDVSLVLDIGNSRTCGILIERFPTALAKATMGDAMLLRLRDLARPQLTYSETFESHVELAQPSFGEDDLSEQSRANAFLWPSIVRVGPEAVRLRDQAEGTEALSGLTSPKRYLFDITAQQQPWRFQQTSYDVLGGPPPLDTAVRNYVGPRGDVKRQVNAESAFYRKKLTYQHEKIDITAYPQRLSFSRSSMFTFLLAEIIWQAFTMINNPQVRATRPEADTPRKLMRVILTLPTAMPISEQQILRSRALAAVKLLWDLAGWTEHRPPGAEEPEIQISLDEASCAQLVYLYGEITERFAGDANAFFDLAGRPRPRPVMDGEKTKAPRADERSMRIASIDVGGGTTDLMVTTYFVDAGKALVPYQAYREGFRVAGDDLLRDVIERCILPVIEGRLVECGLHSAREFLNRCFGIDRVDMSELDRHLRRQCVTRVLRPAAIAVLQAAENADWAEEEQTKSLTLRDMIIAAGSTVDDPAAGRAIRYVDDAASKEGATSFSLLDTRVDIQLHDVRNAVAAIFGDVFDNLAEIVDHLDCDLVLFAGRPSRLPAVVELFVNKLPVAPHNVIALGNYQAGPWYPFASLRNFTISDPKTVTVTGAMLAQLAQRDIENFTVFLDRLKHRSCAQQIGLLSGTGQQLRTADVKFKFDSARPAGFQETATYPYYAPVRLGYRQIPFDRWVATPLYLLRLLDDGKIPKPVEVELARGTSDDPDDFTRTEAAKEEIRIESATSAAGADVTKSMVLELNTMKGAAGYWLDTGLLTIG